MLWTTGVERASYLARRRAPGIVVLLRLGDMRECTSAACEGVRTDIVIVDHIPPLSLRLFVGSQHQSFDEVFLYNRQ